MSEKYSRIADMLRRRKGDVSLREMARAIGINYNAVFRIAHGKPISSESLLKVLQWLNLLKTPDYSELPGAFGDAILSQFDIRNLYFCTKGKHLFRAISRELSEPCPNCAAIAQARKEERERCIKIVNSNAGRPILGHMAKDLVHIIEVIRRAGD